MELYHYIQKIRERQAQEASTEVKAGPLEGTPVSVSTDSGSGIKDEENALEIEQQPEQVSRLGQEYELELELEPELELDLGSGREEEQGRELRVESKSESEEYKVESPEIEFEKASETELEPECELGPDPEPEQRQLTEPELEPEVSPVLEAEVEQKLGLSPGFDPEIEVKSGAASEPSEPGPIVSPPVWQSRAILLVCAVLVLFTAAYAMYYWTDFFLKPKFSEPRNLERKTKKIHLMKKNPINSHPAPLLDQAKMFLIAKDYNKAVSVFKKYLQQNNDPDALNDYGAALLLADRCNEAVSYFQKALSKKDDSEIRLNLAAALICVGKPLQAWKEFESVTEKNLSSSSAKILEKQLEEFFYFR